MELYYFDKTTGEYLFSGDAPRDPLTGAPMKVRGSTLEAPPVVKSGQIAVFTGDEFQSGKWNKVDDFRGAWYSKKDGSVLIVSSLGVSPDTKMYTQEKWPGPAYRWNESSMAWEVDKDAAAAADDARIRSAIKSHALDQLACEYLVKLGWMDKDGNLVLSKIPKEFK